MSVLQGKQRQSCCCLRAAQGSFFPTMEGWEGCLIQYFHVLRWFVQSSAQVCPILNYQYLQLQRKLFFSSFPFHSWRWQGKELKRCSKWNYCRSCLSLSESASRVRGGQQEENAQALACLLLLSFVIQAPELAAAVGAIWQRSCLSSCCYFLIHPVGSWIQTWHLTTTLCFSSFCYGQLSSVSWQVSLTQVLRNTAKSEMPSCWWDTECVGGTSQPWSTRAKLTRLVWSWLQAHYWALINTRAAAVTVQG